MVKFKKIDLSALAEGEKEEARARFAHEMETLAARTGERNGNLVRIALIGLRAGMPPDEIAEAILANCGEPPLTAYEVRRAVARAKGIRENNTPDAQGTPENSGEPSRPFFIKNGLMDRGFVARMKEAGRGTTVRGLQKKAWLMPTALNPRGAMAAHVKAMCGFRGDISATRFDLFANRFWVGKDKCEGGLLPPFNIIMNGVPGEVPNFITSNALTGEAAPTKDGQGLTRRGDNCVVAPRQMLIEFDKMPREDQLAFVGGVIKTGTLKVVSVVDSGNKSLHVLVEVEGEYAQFREKVLRLCCSSEDPRERIDRAVLHPSALTRLAGAVRPDTGKVQELVWYRAG